MPAKKKTTKATVKQAKPKEDQAEPSRKRWTIMEALIPYKVIVLLALAGIVLSAYMEVSYRSIQLMPFGLSSNMVGVLGYAIILFLAMLRVFEPTSHMRYGALIFFVALAGIVLSARWLLVDLRVVQGPICFSCLMQAFLIFAIMFACIAGLDRHPWDLDQFKKEE